MASGTRSEATKELFVTTLVCTPAFGCTPTAASGYLPIRSLLLAVGALTQTLRHNDSLHEQIARDRSPIGLQSALGRV